MSLRHKPICDWSYIGTLIGLLLVGVLVLIASEHVANKKDHQQEQHSEKRDV